MLPCLIGTRYTDGCCIGRGCGICASCCDGCDNHHDDPYQFLREICTQGAAAGHSNLLQCMPFRDHWAIKPFVQRLERAAATPPPLKPDEWNPYAPTKENPKGLDGHFQLWKQPMAQVRQGITWLTATMDSLTVSHINTWVGTRPVPPPAFYLMHGNACMDSRVDTEAQHKAYARHITGPNFERVGYCPYNYHLHQYPTPGEAWMVARDYLTSMVRQARTADFWQVDKVVAAIKLERLQAEEAARRANTGVARKSRTPSPIYVRRSKRTKKQ